MGQTRRTGAIPLALPGGGVRGTVGEGVDPSPRLAGTQFLSVTICGPAHPPSTAGPGGFPISSSHTFLLLISSALKMPSFPSRNLVSSLGRGEGVGGRLYEGQRTGRFQVNFKNFLKSDRECAFTHDKLACAS